MPLLIVAIHLLDERPIILMLTKRSCLLHALMTITLYIERPKCLRNGFQRALHWTRGGWVFHWIWMKSMKCGHMKYLPWGAYETLSRPWRVFRLLWCGREFIKNSGDLSLPVDALFSFCIIMKRRGGRARSARAFTFSFVYYFFLIYYFYFILFISSRRYRVWRDVRLGRT